MACRSVNDGPGPLRPGFGRGLVPGPVPGPCVPVARLPFWGMAGCCECLPTRAPAPRRFLCGMTEAIKRHE